jgi:hypothetical protein
MSVRTQPGLMATTRVAVASSSLANLTVSMLSPALLMAYPQIDCVQVPADRSRNRRHRTRVGHIKLHHHALGAQRRPKVTGAIERSACPHDEVPANRELPGKLQAQPSARASHYATVLT